MKNTTLILSDKSFGEFEFSALAFSHGLSMPLSYMGDDRPEGMFSITNPVFHDISVTKLIDLHTPKMNMMCATGKVIDQISVSILHSTGDPHSNDEAEPPWNHYEVLLEKCLFTSISASSSSDHPIESITFVFKEIRWTYTPFDNKAESAKWSRLKIDNTNS